MKLRFMLIISMLTVTFAGMASLGYAKEVDTFSRLGVNLAGGEFTGGGHEFSNQNPGVYQKDYIYPCQKTMDYFSSHGLGLFRIPFRWERIQPQLGEPLDPEELKRLKKVVKCAAKSKALVILDLHNYARYRMDAEGQIAESIVGNMSHPKHSVSVDDLCDVWRRLAKEFGDNPTVVGYGIMNEPHDMPTHGPSWHTISRVMVRAIRAVDADTPILVSGDRWSSAEHFYDANGPDPWICRKVPNIIYEAHVYFDQDGSGKYHRDFQNALSVDPNLLRRAVERVQPFLDWCTKNQVRGFIGKFGVPPESGWGPLLDDFLKTIQEAGVGGCYWAAGPWWGDYPLSIQPKEGASAEAPQMKILKRYSKHGLP